SDRRPGTTGAFLAAVSEGGSNRFRAARRISRFEAGGGVAVASGAGAVCAAEAAADAAVAAAETAADSARAGSARVGSAAGFAAAGGGAPQLAVPKRVEAPTG